MKIGLLPLYIALYDESNPELRFRLERFYECIAKKIEANGIEVVRTQDFCRLKPEFEQAMSKFEQENADAIVTIHMAYSPSLESIEALANTTLPIIVLDTTETLEFTSRQEDIEVMYNHGIHGVMDMCNLLKRRQKSYVIAAGHYEESDVVQRVCGYVRAAVAAKALSQAKVGLFGGRFEGMGDFAVEPSELKTRFGITIEEIDAIKIKNYVDEIEDAKLQEELANNENKFVFDSQIEESTYHDSVKNCLGMRMCIEENKYTAFSANFQKISDIPFIECCKSMERGIGYAGEGDGLTSAFVGALLTSYPETNFVEIFCPDWKNNTLFLSHMGEMNYRVAAQKPLLCKVEGFVSTHVAYARMKGGKGVFVNISRGVDDYQLLLSEAEMLDVNEDRFDRRIRGWMKMLSKTTDAFLEEYSMHGATHHSIFVYGATIKELEFFGALLSMKTVVI